MTDFKEGDLVLQRTAHKERNGFYGLGEIDIIHGWAHWNPDLRGKVSVKWRVGWSWIKLDDFRKASPLEALAAQA